MLRDNAPRFSGMQVAAQVMAAVFALTAPLVAAPLVALVSAPPAPPAQAVIPARAQAASTSGVIEPAWLRLGDGPERAFHSLVFDPGNDYLWLFGGLSGDAAGDDFQNTVYERAAGDDAAPWFVAPIPGLRPPALAYHAAVFDPLRRRMIVAGGLLDRRGTVLAEPIDGDSIWWLDLAERTSARWANRIVAGNGTERFGHAALYVPELDAMILSGGFSSFDAARSDHVALLLGEDPMRWVRLPEEGFSPRGGHALAWDGASSRLLAYGGLASMAGAGDALADVLALDLSDGLDAPGPWEVMSPAGSPPAPPGRAFATHAFDPTTRRWWFHGGSVESGAGGAGIAVLDVASDPPAWTTPPADGEGPPDRIGTGSAWDGARRRLIVHGGAPDSGAAARDTWALSVPASDPTAPPSASPDATPTATASPTSIPTDDPPDPSPTGTAGTPSPTPFGGSATPTWTPIPSATSRTDEPPDSALRIHLPWTGRGDG